MPTKCYIGTSGWNYPHWKDKFYPTNIKKDDWLSFYSKKFNTTEINYSFYRWPTEKTMKDWYDNSPYHFEYTMKSPRMITHMKKLKNPEPWVDDFYDLTSILKEKIGCHLFQLPPNYKHTGHNMGKLRKFIETLDKRKKNVIEFRDRSWWNKDVYDLFKVNNIIFCNVSGLGMPDEIVKTSDIIYFRFHGNNYSTKYTDKELRKHADKMKHIDAQRIYVHFNNDQNAFAPHNALWLKEQLEGGT